MSELLLTPKRARVGLCELVADGVVLDVAGEPQAVEAWPDERLAQRVTRLATRVVAVELFGLESSSPRAELTAVWHRVPHTRSLPMSAALALTLGGVPTYVVRSSTRDRVSLPGGVRSGSCCRGRIRCTRGDEVSDVCGAGTECHGCHDRISSLLEAMEDRLVLQEAS